MKYKFLKHTADIKFKAFGGSLKELLENSAEALLRAMTDDKIKCEKKYKISVEGKDFESLLYGFLEEILILIDSKNFLISKINLEVDEKNFMIKGIVEGDEVNNYDLRTHVKSITYSEMFVKNVGENWECQVVVDV
jgi:SHS2 domain-containing protein